jgi:glycosyltransferase involved in cell wall biosynthesis
MNLLVLSTWHPYPPDNGARLRAWHLLDSLAERHRIRVVAGRQDDAPTEVPPALLARFDAVQIVPWRWYDGAGGGLKALCDPVPRSIRETPNPALEQVVAAELNRRPDAVLVMQLGMDAYLPETDLPLVLEEAEVTGWSQPVGWRARLTEVKAHRYWRSRFRRYRAVTVVSEAEAVAVRSLVGKDGPNVHVVPNGVLSAHYNRASRPVTGRLIYNGSLTYGPNRDAVRWFVEAILPEIVRRRPDAHLVVTGRIPDNCKDLAGHPNVCLTGYLDDVRDALEEASVCVVPLRSGGGTRLKILEAWAAGLPVVSTRVGAAGLDGATDGREILLADDPTSFATSVVRLLDEAATRERLGAGGRALARERYDWASIAQGLERVLLEVTQ